MLNAEPFLLYLIENNLSEILNLTLQQLKYIITVAESSSVTEAARKLFISQPSLTAAIRDLEREMDLLLFARTNKGVLLTKEGEEFLAYARQVVEQSNLLEDRFLNKREVRPHFSVSCQHYSFAVNAFVDIIKEFGVDKYDFTLRETETYQIIQDVSNRRSELGILYTCSKNEVVINKILKSAGLSFTELFIAKPHVFISSKNPLANKRSVTLKDLEPYPYLSFEQGDYNSFYFSEEILSTLDRDKNIKVSDRATLFNLVIGLNGYTVSSGVISQELNGENIIAIPLKVDEHMRIGTIQQMDMPLTRYGKAYLNALKKHI